MSKQVNPITSLTFTWENCSLTTAEDIQSVKTRILPTEIQVRFYNQSGLMSGLIWPLSAEQKQTLFSLVEMCSHEWNTADYSVAVCDGSRWQLKICTKGKCLRTIEGTAELPPQGQIIRDWIARIIGEENCYIF